MEVKTQKIKSESSGTMYPLSPSPNSHTRRPNGPENMTLTKWAIRMRLIDITNRSSHFKVPKIQC